MKVICIDNKYLPMLEYLKIYDAMDITDIRYLIDFGAEHGKWEVLKRRFITLAKWREQQLNEILDD